MASRTAVRALGTNRPLCAGSVAFVCMGPLVPCVISPPEPVFLSCLTWSSAGPAQVSKSDQW